MGEISTLREMRPEAPAAELDAMRMAAREQFVTRTRRAQRARRRWRLPVLVGGLTAAAAAGAAAALVLTSGPAAVPGQHGRAGHAGLVVTAAWTVREDADGTVTVYLQQYADPAGLQQTLQSDGVNAIVRQIPAESVTVGGQTVEYPACNYTAFTDAEPRAVQQAVWTLGDRAAGAVFTIHPEAMPQGSALFLAFLPSVSPKNGAAGLITLKPVVLSDDTVPACVPSKPLPTAAPLPPSGP